MSRNNNARIDNSCCQGIGAMLFLMSLSSAITLVGMSFATKQASHAIGEFCEEHNATCHQQRDGASLTNHFKDVQNPLVLFALCLIGNIVCTILFACCMSLKNSCEPDQETTTRIKRLNSILMNQKIIIFILALSLLIPSIITNLLQASFIKNTICENGGYQNGLPIKCYNILRINDTAPYDINAFSVFSNSLSHKAMTNGWYTTLSGVAIPLVFWVIAVCKSRREKHHLAAAINGATSYNTFSNNAYCGDNAL